MNKKRVVVFEHTATERSTVVGGKSQIVATSTIWLLSYHFFLQFINSEIYPIKQKGANINAYNRI